MMYVRFPRPLRNVEGFLHECSIEVSFRIGVRPELANLTAIRGGRTRAVTSAFCMCFLAIDGAR